MSHYSHIDWLIMAYHFDIKFTANELDLQGITKYDN